MQLKAPGHMEWFWLAETKRDACPKATRKVSRCRYSSVQCVCEHELSVCVWTWAARLVTTATAVSSTTARERASAWSSHDPVSALVWSLSLSRSGWPDDTHSHTCAAVCVWFCFMSHGPHMSRHLLLHELIWSETHGKMRITNTYGSVSVKHKHLLTATAWQARVKHF